MTHRVSNEIQEYSKFTDQEAGAMMLTTSKLQKKYALDIQAIKLPECYRWDCFIFLETSSKSDVSGHIDGLITAPIFKIWQGTYQV